MVAVSGDDSQPAVAGLELARDGFALARIDGELHGADEVLAECLLVLRFGEFVEAGALEPFRIAEPEKAHDHRFCIAFGVRVPPRRRGDYESGRSGARRVG